jgi:hypothetical protein
VIETSYDNLNGGVYGHEVRFFVPPLLYGDIIDDIGQVRSKLKDKLNSLKMVDDEFIEAVYLEPAPEHTHFHGQYRIGGCPESQVLIEPSTEDLIRIWNAGRFRMFVSHKAEHKRTASELKQALERFGISCFVAHEDIEPTREWLLEIERALASMHAMIALLTPGFGDSDWTDQEVGIAIGKGIPVIPLKCGADPYGFIGKYQALKYRDKASDTARVIYELLWCKPGLKDILEEGLVAAFENAIDYRHANELVNWLEKRNSLPMELVQRLEKAPDSNVQVARAYGVKDRLPALLKRLKGA